MLIQRRSVAKELPSTALDHASQKESTAGQFRDEDVLVDGVRSFADGAHAVERRNADASREVSIRSAAHGSFFQPPVKLSRNGFGLLVESDDAGITLHRQPVDSPFDGKLAMTVEGLE